MPAVVPVQVEVQQGVPPSQEEAAPAMYASQRKQLISMGFGAKSDEQTLQALLELHSGDVVAVCQELLDADE